MWRQAFDEKNGYMTIFRPFVAFFGYFTVLQMFICVLEKYILLSLGRVPILSMSAQTEPHDAAIEEAIILSFGSAIIEFEETLFQKVLLISGKQSLMTMEMFRKHLQEMHAKGYVKPVIFHGRKCWKKMIVLDELQRDLTPREIRESIAKGTSYKPIAGDRAEVKDKVVSESREIAHEIVSWLKEKLKTDSKLSIDKTAMLRKETEKMRRALADSPTVFLDYVRVHLPTLYEPLKELLFSRGEDVMLPALRIAEWTLAEG